MARAAICSPRSTGGITSAHRAALPWASTGNRCCATAGWPARRRCRHAGTGPATSPGAAHRARACRRASG
jgi:hypothetical protein